MADSMLRLKVESQEYDAKLKRAAEGIQRLAAKIHDSQGEFAGLKKEQKEFIKDLQYMNTVSQTATGKVKELETAYKGLRTMYNGFNAFEKNSEEGKILAEQLSILREKTLQARKEMEDANKSLSSTGGFLDQLTSKFTVNIDALKLFDIGMKAAGAALDVAKDAFFASEATVDEWGRTMASAESLYEGFLNAINTGDISGYLNRIDQISTAAKAAYNELDRLGTMKTIQTPQMVRQETENQRMRTMLMTGRYIAPADGQRAADGMKTGDLLSPAQIKNIERHLQNGMQTIVGLTKNELNQTGRAIDAYYNKLAKQNGISLDEFRKGTASMEAYEYRLSMAQEYRRFESAHTTLRQVYNPQTGDYETMQYRDNVTNPHAKYRGWEAFRVDKMGENSYNDLVGLIRQQQQQTGQLYSTIGQSYRTINRVEGVTPSKLLHGDSDSGKGGSTATDPVSKAADEVVKAEQSYAESINVAQEKLMANVMKSEEYDKLVLSGQERLADAYLKAYNTTGNDKYLDAFRETSEHILDMRGVVDANIQAQKLAEQATREQAEAAKKLAEAERKRSEQYANWQSNSTSGIANYVSYQQGLLGQQSIGSGDYAQIASNLADANTYKNLMQVAIQNGLNDIVIEAAPLWQKIIGETDIQDSTWQQLQDKINAKLKELGVDPIKINFATGNKAEQSGDKAEKHENQIGKVVSGMTSITNSLQHIGVEIPEGFNKVINIMNIIQSVLAMIQASKAAGAAGSFLSNIPILGGLFGLFGAANGGVVHATNGFSGIVPGNLMSGDQVPALLNSGEVVLNRAQAGVLASDMRQGSIGYEGRTQAVIESDQIKLVLRNGAQARGMTLSDYLEI